MEYELKDWKIDVPLRDNGDETSTQLIIVTVGIVGDIYGFIPPDQRKNRINVILPNKLKDIDELKEICTAAAVQLVKDNYPNT